MVEQLSGVNGSNGSSTALETEPVTKFTARCAGMADQPCGRVCLRAMLPDLLDGADPIEDLNISITPTGLYAFQSEGETIGYALTMRRHGKKDCLFALGMAATEKGRITEIGPDPNPGPADPTCLHDRLAVPQPQLQL